MRARTAALAGALALALAACGNGSDLDPEPTDGPVTAQEAAGPTAGAAAGAAGAAAGPDLSGAATVAATKAGSAQSSSPSAAPCEAVPPAPKVRGGLPELALGCLGPGPGTKLSALRGPLVLNVWASWCKPCTDEAPYLVEAAKALGGRVAFLGIDMADAPKPAQEWLALFGVPYPSLEDQAAKVRAKLHVPGPPATLFVRSDGTVAKVHYGAFTSAQEVAAAIADHLGVTS